jgi:hypothetical protein
MKQRKLRVAFTAMLTMVAATLCAQNNDGKIKAMRDSIELLKAKYELDSVRLALENAQRQQGVVEGTKIIMPCDNALDSSPDYINGWGQGEDLWSDGEAYKVARENAKLDIVGKWVGFGKTLTKEYYSQVNESDEETKNRFERSAQVASEVTIDRFMHLTCREAEMTKRGTHQVTVAFRVPVADVEGAFEEVLKGQLQEDGVKWNEEGLHKGIASAIQKIKAERKVTH